MPGRTSRNIIEIPLSGETLPASLERIDLEIRVAGQEFSQSFAPSTNLTHTFAWGGNDAYERPVMGTATASVDITYVYPRVYYAPSDFSQAFAAVSEIPGVTIGGTIGGDRTAGKVTLATHHETSLGSFNPVAAGLGSWSLTPHHGYDVSGRVLYTGDGRRRSANSVDAVITTVAGTGDAGVSGDGGPATEARLNVGSGVALGPDGSLYIVVDHRIRRVGPDGIITTVAGTSVFGFSGDGGPATEARLSHPTGVALGPDGSLYIVDTSNDRIRRVGPDGIITTVAGGAPNVIRCSGDGGPATEASLGVPFGVALGPDGSLYIAGLLGNCIRRVGPDGIITTVAGPGVLGFSGDGGPASEARLNRPFGVALSPNGSLYFADTENGRIRRVGPDGTITTVAGIGILGFSGDGGPASEARLGVRPGVALGPDRSLYIADLGNGRIRRVGLPGFAADDIAIASEDGAALYRFDASGRHLATRDAVTGATLYSFTYDAAGRLAEVKDVDGDITRIEREASGAPTAIVAPDGQRTRFTLDADGYLAAVTNPAGERHAMAYTDGGLMSTFTTPRGPTNRFTYDARGLLVRDLNAGGGGWVVNRVEHERDDGYDVTMTSGEGRTSTFTVEPLTTRDRRQRNIAPDGTVQTRLFKTNGETTTTAPDGTGTTVLEGPDPRFGMQSPLPSRTSIKMPSGLTLATTLSRTAALANPSDPLSLTSLTDTTAVNGRTSTRRFDRTNLSYTTTTPAGRTTTLVVDAENRPARGETPGLQPIDFTYNARGRLSMGDLGRRRRQPAGSPWATTRAVPPRVTWST